MDKGGTSVYVPEEVLPTQYNTKLYKEIQGDLLKTLECCAAEHILVNKAIAQGDFNELLTSNLSGVRKIMFMIHPNPADQEQVYSASQISINNSNINSKHLYNTNITTPQEAYRQVSEIFNANGQDVNT